MVLTLKPAALRFDGVTNQSPMDRWGSKNKSTTAIAEISDFFDWTISNSSNDIYFKKKKANGGSVVCYGDANGYQLTNYPLPKWQDFITIDSLWIDFINYFVHREINNYTVNDYNSIKRVKLAVFHEQTIYLTTLKEIYPKFTCSSRVNISIGNKHMFCSDVYIFSPQIRCYSSWQSAFDKTINFLVA